MEAFDKPKHVGEPSMPDKYEFLKDVMKVVDSHRFTNDGPFVQELEERVCEELNVENCIAVANATMGLEMLGVVFGPGEIIMPSFTFIATAHAARWVGATPVFVDIDPKTHCIDPMLVEQAITDKTTAICGVHLWGRPCAVDELTGIARRRSLQLYFDAAHAFGCKHNDTFIGNFGHAEVFSFHATKFLHSFEGGAITTNDNALADRLRRMRNFGYEDYVVHNLGCNAKMTEVCAAAGLHNLGFLEKAIRHNIMLHYHYRLNLRNLIGVRVAEACVSDTRPYVILEIDEGRDEIMKALWQENIRARIYFDPPCHLAKPYSDTPQSLPLTEALNKRVLALPSGSMVSVDDVNKICAILQKIVERGTND